MDVPYDWPLDWEVTAAPGSPTFTPIGEEVREGIEGAQEGLRSLTVGTKVCLNGGRHKVWKEAKKQTEGVKWYRSICGVDWRNDNP